MSNISKSKDSENKKKVFNFFKKEDLKPLTKEQVKKLRLNAYKFVY
jgi:hypothetical protein